MSERIRLNGVEVVFANLDDTGYGKSITIAVTDPAVEKQITEWVKENKIGKGEKAGVPNFKEYEGKKQYAFKINDYTRFAGINGLSMNNLGFGARISLIASAFEWENKFGKGISSSLTAVLVEKGANSASDDDLAELLSDSGVTVVPATAESTKAKDVVLEDITDEVNLEDIPF